MQTKDLRTIDGDEGVDMKDRVVSVTIVRTIECDVETVQWNYLDGEHLTIVHSGYKNAQVLYEDGHNSLVTTLVSVPGIPFIRTRTTLFVSMIDNMTQVTYANQYGIWSRTRITCKRLEDKLTEIEMEYLFYLTGFRRILASFLGKRIPIWNETVWVEDLPLKERRQMVKDLGFVDFRGLAPNEFSELFLPLRRPADSPINTHPLRLQTRRRTKLRDLRN
jgi:hypothetical protein